MPHKIPEHYELYIGFVGLTAFVPRTERLENGGGEIVTRTTAILPRVIQGDAEAGYTTANGRDMPTHHAKLKLIVGTAHGGSASNGSKPVPYQPEDDDIRDAFAQAGISPRVWTLDRQALHIKPPSPALGGTTFLRSLRGHDDPLPFDRLELSDVTWLSSIREIFDSATGTQQSTDRAAVARIDSGCLSGKASRVAARIELPRGGCLASLGLVEHQQQIRRYGYRCLHSGSTCRVGVDRALSQNVVMRLPVHDPKGKGVTLSSKTLGGRSQWSVTIRPGKLFDRSKIILLIGHQPNHEVRVEPMDHGPTMPVEHFEVFYELSAGKPDRMDRPVPVMSEKTGRPSLGVILPGAGDLDELSRRAFPGVGGALAQKIRLAKAVVRALKKDTGQICPNSTFEPEPLG